MLINTPLVSIIVPIYKVENYIHRSVNSLINQTYNNIEIILVDDGSPDKCPQICEEYAKTDSRIKVVHKKNGGLSDARNTGLDIAKGDYITFLDSDDFLSLNAVEEFVKIAINENVDVICSGINIIDKEGNIYDKLQSNVSFKTSSKNAVKLLFEDTFPYNFAPSKFFKSKLFNNVYFPKGRIYEDIATTYLVISKAKDVYCMKECMYYYEREREGNISSELNTNKAAWSYYCGCLNSKEHIDFCKRNAEFHEMLPIVQEKLFIWSKLCIESSIKLGLKEYNTYCNKVKIIIQESRVSLPLKLKIITTFNNIYYFLYKILK